MHVAAEVEIPVAVGGDGDVVVVVPAHLFGDDLGLPRVLTQRARGNGHAVFGIVVADKLPVSDCEQRKHDRESAGDFGDIELPEDGGGFIHESLQCVFLRL